MYKCLLTTFADTINTNIHKEKMQVSRLQLCEEYIASTLSHFSRKYSRINFLEVKFVNI